MQCKNKIYESKPQKDTREGFIPEVQHQHHKGAYISVYEPTKGRVALNPKSFPNDHLDQVWLFNINPHKDLGNTNFPGLNHMIWEFSGNV
jgi:hypothetical protein